MMDLIMTFALIYFILWLTFKMLGLVVKIALFPIKLAFSIIFAILGIIVFPAMVIFFMVPLIAVIGAWLIGKIFCPI